MNRIIPKKFLAAVALALFVGGAALPTVAGIGLSFVQVAHAEEASTTDESLAQQQDAAALAQAAKKNNELDCGANVLCGLVQFTGAIFTFSSNLFATLTGLLADFSVWYSIQSSTYSKVNPFLETGWKLIRDFTNLLFIFALFAVAFSLIFGTDLFKLEPKRTFAYVILMALLVNFSFFLTRVVVEVGNTAATILYSNISNSATDITQADTNVSSVNTGSAISLSTAGKLGSPSSFLQNTEFNGMKSISLGILSKVNPQSLILDTMTVQSSGVIWKSYDWSFYITYLFLSFAVLGFNLVLIYIFVSITILFMGRIVGLMLAIMFSPLAFVSVVIPSLRDRDYIGFTDWIEQVVGLSLVAPVYLIFLYLTILFLNIPFPQKADGYLTGAVIIMGKLILIALILLRGKKVAESMSGHAGKLAGNLIGGATSLALGAATGGTSMLARQTLGRAGAGLATSGTLSRIAQSKPENDIDSVQRRMNFSNSIRNIGVGKYRLGNTGLGKGLADRVQTGAIGATAAKAGAAQGLRAFGKNLYTVNPLDRGIGGASTRKAVGLLGKMTGNAGLNTTLAKDYVKDMQKNMTRNRMLDIEALKNSKKTLTNVIGNTMTAGINQGTAPGGGGATTATGPGTSSGPITVTGANTGAVPSAIGWTGAKGPVPGAKVPNDFTGMKLAPSSAGMGAKKPGPDDDDKNPPAGGASPVAPTPPNSGAALAAADGVAAAKEYDTNQRMQGSSNAMIQNLTVKNLNVENLGGAAAGNPGASGKAASLLSGISLAAPAALNYKPSKTFGDSPVKTGGTSTPVQTSPSNPQTDISASAPMVPLDQSGVVLDTLGGDDAFNFGGIQRPDTETEE